MELLEIPKLPVLRGEEAIWALSNFINELEEQRGKELTDKQCSALIRLAKGLMSSIEEDIKSEISNKNVMEKRFATKLKKQLQNKFLNTLSSKTQNG
ncbi:MAG: hypothetical protein ACFFCW_40340 [Candidatus Hodarchaeota archaeon]